jgi:hypothetical protein
MNNNNENPTLNKPAVSGSYIYRNEYPKCVESLWDKLPEEGQTNVLAMLSLRILTTKN